MSPFCRAFFQSVALLALPGATTAAILDLETGRPSMSAPDSDSTVKNPINVRFTLPEAALPGSVTLSFGDQVLALAPSQESVGLHLFSFNPARPTDSPQILSGGRIVDGVYSVTLRYQDALGNPAATFTAEMVTVDARPAQPVATEVYRPSFAVPNAGTDSRIVAHSLWNVFGPPAINDAGQIAFAASWYGPFIQRVGAQVGKGIFVDGKLVVKVGEPVPGLTGVTFKAFKDPVLSEGGRVAFLATLTGTGVTAKNDTVVMSNGRTGTVEILAREGDPAPETGGAKYAALLNVTLKGDTTAGTIFTATLANGTGLPRTNATRNAGAWWQPEGQAAVALLVRKGNPFSERAETVKKFLLLNTLAGSPGQSRAPVAGDAALVQLTLSSGRDAVALATPGTPTFLTTLTATDDALGDELAGGGAPGPFWKKIGQPSADDSGEKLAVLGTLQRGRGDVIAANESGIFASADGGQTWSVQARAGFLADGLDGTAVYKSFRDPVSSPTSGAIAFAGRARGGGVRAGNDDAIWWQPVTGGPLEVLAREGAQPPGAPLGARWSAFQSLAYPGGFSGPLFVAKLASGPGKINAASDLALYTTDESGLVHEVIREQPRNAAVPVKSFSVLRAIGGSAGAARSFNRRAAVVVQVRSHFDSISIWKFDLP